MIGTDINTYSGNWQAISPNVGMMRTRLGSGFVGKDGSTVLLFFLILIIRKWLLDGPSNNGISTHLAEVR